MLVVVVQHLSGDRTRLLYVLIAVGARRAFLSRVLSRYGVPQCHRGPFQNMIKLQTYHIVGFDESSLLELYVVEVCFDQAAHGLLGN